MALQGGNMEVKYVKVPIYELIRLLNRDEELSRLEANGVDNWVGYGIDDEDELVLWSEEDVLSKFEEVK